MKIDIKHLAKLSRLKTSAEEEEKFKPQMQSIIELVENLPEININDNLVDKNNPMICREDIVENKYKRDDILSNAPQIQAGCIVVPKVIE